MGNKGGLFYSRKCPGLVMNRYGVVLEGARVANAEEHGAVKREALAEGWRLVSGDDVQEAGRLWERGEENIQPATVNIQHRTTNIQHPTSNIEHPTSNGGQESGGVMNKH